MTPDQEREFLLDHVRYPRLTGEIADADGVGECKNPVCGDFIKIWRKDESGVSKIRMKASGCTICIASASLMSELANGKTVEEIRSLIFLMRESMRPGAAWPSELEKLVALKRIQESPLKVPCTLVGWLALERSLPA